MGQAVFSGGVEHSPHVESSLPGSAGGSGMTLGSSQGGVTTSHGQLPVVGTSRSNIVQTKQFGSAPNNAANTRVFTGASNPSLLSNTAPPSSVAAEGMDSVDRTISTSSTSLVASQPDSVPQRTPIQQETTQVRPSPVHAPSFTVNQAPPAVASGATEGFTPESTQQQPCAPQPGPQVRNDVRSVPCMCAAITCTYCSSMLCSVW